ncbi:MAG: hypothetical protein ACKO9Z_11520 [Planctomycetota bacterium]
MKKPRKSGSGQRAKAFWTPQRAHAAMGLLTRVIDDLRDAAIEAKSAHQGLHRLDHAKGRQTRRHFLRAQSLHDDLVHAREHEAQVLTEAKTLGVEVVDPVQGIAVLPCLTNQGMGMLVLDRFAEEPLIGWRLVDDPPDVVRRIPTVSQESKALGTTPDASTAQNGQGVPEPGPTSAN